MRVRIVKASQPSYWYADRVGQVYETDGLTRDKTNYRIKGDGIRLLGVEDCVVLHSLDEVRNTLNLIAPGSRGKIGEIDVLITQVHIETRQVEYSIAWWDSGQRCTDRVPEYEITDAEKTMKVGFE